MTEERLKEIRSDLECNKIISNAASRELLASLDAARAERDEQHEGWQRAFALVCRLESERDQLRADVATLTRERDEAREWKEVWSPDVARWQRLYAECVGDKSDAEIGRFVRQLARECYNEAVALAPSRPTR